MALRLEMPELNSVWKRNRGIGVSYRGPDAGLTQGTVALIERLEDHKVSFPHRP